MRQRMLLVILVGLSLALLQSPEKTLFPDPHPTAEERAGLDERGARLQEATAAREAAVEDLLMGRRTLEETAERFRRIAETDPVEVLRFLRYTHPDCTDEQLFRRQVLSYANVWLTLQDRDLAPLEDLKKEVQTLEENENGSTAKAPTP